MIKLPRQWVKFAGIGDIAKSELAHCTFTRPCYSQPIREHKDAISMSVSDARIFVAGHKGMVGSALVRALAAAGYRHVFTASRAEVDLTDQAATRRFFASGRIEQVYLAAAKVGGIVANSTRQADFLYENLMIASNVIDAAARHGVKKLLFLGSSCIYPKLSPQPIKEEYLLTGPLEPTNEGYAIAKIAGLKLCEMYRRQHGKDFIAAMPTNLYGPGDNYDPEHSHVIAGLLRRFHEAKRKDNGEVVVWGSGKPRREFLHVDDLAAACLLLMRSYSSAEPVNVGTGTDITIAELATKVRDVVGGKFRLVFDLSKPDGTPAKRLDTTRIESLGWRAGISFDHGLAKTYGDAVASGALGS